MRFHAFHGHLPVESKNRKSALENVDLKKSYTIDEASAIIKDNAKSNLTQEMNISSDLIEHVAERIATRLKKELPLIKSLEITVKKEKPPLHFDLQGVEVSLKR